MFLPVRIPGKLPTVTFSSSEQILKDSTVPREHKFILHSVKEMTLGVFSCTVREYTTFIQWYYTV